MQKNYNILNFYFFCIAFINFCISFCFYLSIVISTSFAIDILHESTSNAGLASGMFIIGTMAARLLIGKSLDNINLKKWLLFSLIIYLIISLLYFISYNFWILIITRFLHGFSYGISSSICGVIVVRLIPSFRRGEGIGLYALSIVLASALAPFLAIYLTKQNMYKISFFIMCIIIILAILAVFVMKVREIKRGENIKIPNGRANFFHKIFDFFEPSTARICLIICIIASCYGAVLSFIGDFSLQRDLVFAGSIFFVVYAVTSLFGRPIAGRIFDKKGHNVVLISALLFFILALILIAFASNSWMLILAAIFTGLGYGNFFSSGQSYAIKVAPKQKVGLATSSYYIALDFGMGVGPFFLGFIESGFGYRVMFLACAFIVFLALVLYYFLIAKRAQI